MLDLEVPQEAKLQTKLAASSAGLGIAQKELWVTLKADTACLVFMNLLEILGKSAGLPKTVYLLGKVPRGGLGGLGSWVGGVCLRELSGQGNQC